MSKKILILDYETRSKIDLKRAGAHKYAEDASTEVLCYAYKWLGESGIYSRAYPHLDNTHLIKCLNDADLIVAHNALFERMITEHKVLSGLSPDKWLCTASMARVLALPAKLEQLGIALKLGSLKDMVGHRLMLKMSKPRRATKYNAVEWHETAEDLWRLTDYCIKDVEVEELVLNRLMSYKPFTSLERKVWLLDQKMNTRGFKIDVDFCTHALNIINQESFELNKEVSRITGGELESTDQVGKLTQYIKNLGVDINSLNKASVDAALQFATGDAHRLLTLRQALSKSSTGKYAAFIDRVSSDQRVRDNLIYHGPSTGRWAGTGVQPQNFPRGTVKISNRDFDFVKECDLKLLKALYGNQVLDLLASMLRGVIVAPHGFTLMGADYAAIEARVLFWLAQELKGLKIFNDDQDLYKDMAATIYKKTIDTITKDERSLGKTTILGLGYQMGLKKFKETCEAQGIKVSEDMIETAHSSYRAKFSKVPQLWYNIEAAAKAAVKRKTKVKINRLTWYVDRDFLFCELPSGRRLAYHNPSIDIVQTHYGPKEALHFYGVNSLTKKYTRESTYGGRLTENVVQAISRDIMAEAMLRAEAQGFKLILSVHDELICETPTDSADVKLFENVMSERPTWALDCPIKAEGWVNSRYKK